MRPVRLDSRGRKKTASQRGDVLTQHLVAHPLQVGAAQDNARIRLLGLVPPARLVVEVLLLDKGDDLLERRLGAVLGRGVTPHDSPRTLAALGAAALDAAAHHRAVAAAQRLGVDDLGGRQVGLTLEGRRGLDVAMLETVRVARLAASRRRTRLPTHVGFHVRAYERALGAHAEAARVEQRPDHPEATDDVILVLALQLGVREHHVVRDGRDVARRQGELGHQIKGVAGHGSRVRVCLQETCVPKRSLSLQCFCVTPFPKSAYQKEFNGPNCGAMAIGDRRVSDEGRGGRRRGGGGLVEDGTQMSNSPSFHRYRSVGCMRVDDSRGASKVSMNHRWTCFMSWTGAQDGEKSRDDAE